MQLDITLKNYRCFEHPIRISLRNGITSFIGVNNSGKSSILRFFYEFRSLFPLISNRTGHFANALSHTDQPLTIEGIRDINEIFCKTNERDLEIEFDFIPGEVGELLTPDRLVITFLRKGQTSWIADLYVNGKLLEGGPNNQFAFRGQEESPVLMASNSPIANMRPIFQALAPLASTLYIGPFRNAITVSSPRPYYDIQVGQAFIQRWRSLKTGTSKKSNEVTYKLTKEIEQIFEFKSLEINASEDSETLQIFINGESYNLPELGSGITQFIVVLAHAAASKPAFILIDEPELNLHPSLQLDFLTTLSSYASSGTLFATHSIGLARSASDRIYSVRRVDVGGRDVREYERTPNLSEFLGELSFSGYQELGFNKVLLVEGRTDVKTIQQFLRIWKLDHKILLVPLGGGSLINPDSEAELLELSRISPGNIFTVIDSEREVQGAPLEARRQAFVDICNKPELKIKCHVLERRAIENYLSDRAIKKIKSEKYHSLEPFDKLEKAKPAWGKEENWRIAREMTPEEIEPTDLGQFLKSLAS